MSWSDMIASLLVGIFAGIIAAYIAYRRATNPIRWFFIGLFFGPLSLLFFFFSPSRKKKPLSITPPKPQPQPYVFGPANKYWYFLDSEQTQIGPMSYTALSTHWKQGKIKPETFVWHEDLTDWKELKELIREAPV